MQQSQISLQPLILCDQATHTHTHTGPCTHSSTHCFFQPADGRLNEAETTSCRTLSLPDSLCVSVCEHCYYHFICKPSAFSLTVIHLQQESDRLLRHTVYEPRPTDQRVRLKPFNTALCVPPLSHQPKLMLDQNETQRHTTGLQRDNS